ncbi:ABC transporter substrate-binding protein [Colwelliaceae bacterium 6441]
MSKTNYSFWLSIFLCLVNSFAISAAEDNIINFAIQAHSIKQEQTFRNKLREFESQNPTIKVRVRKLSSASFPILKKNLLSMIDDVDVINWFSGKRLNALVDDGLIVNINEFWSAHRLSDKYASATKEQVFYQGNSYALPLTSYIWGFLYKKSLFERLELNQPATWQEFLKVLEVLDNNQIAPIGLGTKLSWQSASWFDYLMLRLHGKDKYQQLVHGDLPYTSNEVKLVFHYWKTLLDKQYFFAQHKFFDGGELMPLLFREVIGLNLIGSFAVRDLPLNHQQEIGFFAFPSMNNVKDNSALVPMSVLSITQKGSKNVSVNKLLEFFSLPSNQSSFNNQLNTISPLATITPHSSELLIQTNQALVEASFLSQYYDREVTFEMGEFAKKAFADFISHKNIEKVTQALEQKRKEYN